MRATFIVSHRAVRALVTAFPVVSDSRRGYVIVIGDWLVRLTEEKGDWWIERLPQSPVLARGHVHSITPVTLNDGHDLLECHGCGREW